MTTMAEDESHLPCHSILEEILKDDDVDDVKGEGKASDHPDGGRNADTTSTERVQADEPQQLANQRCCCGVKDRLDLENAEFARDDFSGICVFTGGRFPCLHVRLANMEMERKYFVALDFTLINNNSSSSGSVVDQGPIDYTEPYYIPRPNHLGGWGWMGEVMYFNINSIANGGLQENGMTLKMACEYEPTLRVLALSSDGAPYRAAAVRFQLKQTAFLVVSLHSEARESKSALVREFLLVRTSEMTRNRYPSDCCRSPSLNGLDPSLASKFVQPFLQTSSFGDNRRQPYQGDFRGQTCRPLRLSMSQGETTQLGSSPLRLPAARLPFKDTPASGNFKAQPQHHFKPAGGVWPHHAWSNGTNGSALGSGQAEAPALTTLFRSLQNCVPPRFVADQKRKVVLANEARPSLPPFGRQQQNVNPDWQQRNSNILLRSSYDAFLGGYLQWVAKTRGGLRQLDADQVKADGEVHAQSPPQTPELADPMDTAKTGLQPGFPYQCGTYYYTPYWNAPVQASPPVQFS